MDVISVQNLVKSYKNGVQALQGMSLQVEKGEIFSLLGPNGAGKSTLIGILTTYLRPTSGQVRILGEELSSQGNTIRRNIACAAQNISIDAHLSLEENMIFQSRLYRVPGREAKKRKELLLEKFGLTRYLQYPVASYSGGIKRRLDIALNLMSNPKILFLDEPTTGMDIQSRMAMWQMLKKTREEFGTTIFLTTHYLEEADSLSDTICIMKEGKEVLQGTPHQLKNQLQKKKIEIQFSTKEIAGQAAKSLQKKFPLAACEQKGAMVFLHSANCEEDFPQTNRWLAEQTLPFTGIQISQPSLDEVFIQLTKSDRGG